VAEPEPIGHMGSTWPRKYPTEDMKIGTLNLGTIGPISGAMTRKTPCFAKRVLAWRRKQIVENDKRRTNEGLKGPNKAN